MKEYRYTVLLEKGETMFEIALFKSRAEAELFTAVVQERYPQFVFSVDDVYTEHTLEELVDEEVELAELQSGIIKNTNNSD